MKRILVTTLSALALSASFASLGYAKPPSGDANPSDRYNPTVDTTQIILPTKGTVKANPPSGDGNPSDLYNSTVDTSQIINPTKGLAATKANPPSGDGNPSDLYNSTVNTGEIINPTPASK